LRRPEQVALFPPARPLRTVEEFRPPELQARRGDGISRLGPTRIFGQCRKFAPLAVAVVAPGPEEPVTPGLVLGRQYQVLVAAPLGNQIARQVTLVQSLHHHQLAYRLGVIAARAHRLRPRLDHREPVGLAAGVRWFQRVVVCKDICSFSHCLAADRGGDAVSLATVGEALGRVLGSLQAKDLAPPGLVPP
jgi:hypothetical protein